MTKTFREGAPCAAADPATAGEDRLAQGELDRILAQQEEGLGTIKVDDLLPPSAAELAIRGVVVDIWRLGFRGAMQARRAPKADAAEISVRPEAPRPGLFRRYAGYYQFIRAEQEELLVRIDQNEAYQDSLNYWNARIAQVDANIAAARNRRGGPDLAQVEALKRHRDEYIANRTRACGVLTSHQMHEEALELALANSPLDRLNDLNVGLKLGGRLRAAPLRRMLPAFIAPDSGSAWETNTLQEQATFVGTDYSNYATAYLGRDDRGNGRADIGTIETARLDGARPARQWRAAEVATARIPRFPFHSSDR